MTEPGMPRDPDLDVPTLVGGSLMPGAWMTSEGVGYGVRAVLEADNGSRYAVSIDPPEAALEFAKRVAAAATEAMLMRQTAAGRPADLEPEREDAAARYERMRRSSVREAQRRLDPQTCSGCGVVEGPMFEPRHHPVNCPRLLDWIALQE